MPVTADEPLRAAIARVATVFGGMTWPARIVCQWVAAGWTTWPAPQVQALTNFLEAWLTWTLRQESPPTPAREVFEACATATSSVTTWITHWNTAADPAATDPHLTEAAQYWELEWGGKPFTYWTSSEANEQAAYTELKAWLATRNLLNPTD